MAALEATYYEVLGVDPDASLAEIRIAYGQQLNHFRSRINAENRPDPALLDRLHLAFSTLTDSVTREAYDASLTPASDIAPVATVDPAPTTDPAATVDPVVTADPVPTVVPVSTVMAEQPHTLPPSPPAPPSIPATPAAPAADADETREEDFSFAGDGGEYFRIWIVNLLLTIVTVGIYSAWAKVRREQYFHRNLLLDGSGFDYHGQPIPILKGRIVAILLVVGLSMTKNIDLVLHGFALVLLLPVVPWLAIKAFRFRAHNTSYRGLRFSFHGTYRQAFKVFVGYGLLSIITLWLAFPLFYRELRKFVLDNTHFGSTPLVCSVGVGDIYRIFLLPVISLLMLVIVLVSAAIAVSPWLLFGLYFLVPAVYLLAITVVVPYVQASTANAVWNTTNLGPHGFISRLPVGGYIALTVVNWLAIIGTLGLFIPWARVRVARYRAEHLSIAVSGSLDDFLAAEATAASALGDETAEMFDLDIGL